MERLRPVAQEAFDFRQRLVACIAKCARRCLCGLSPPLDQRRGTQQWRERAREIVRASNPGECIRLFQGATGIVEIAHIWAREKRIAEKRWLDWACIFLPVADQG